VADVIRAEDRYSIVGLIDSFQEAGTPCFGYKVLGGEKDVPRICRESGSADIFIAIGDNFQREAMAKRLRDILPELKLVTTIHPSAIIGSDVEIGAGSVVMPAVVVVSGSRISEGCLLNTGAILEHDGKMEAWSSLAPGVIAGGYLRLGQRAVLGLGVTVRDRITIGKDTVIGMGAVVTDDMPDHVLAYGSPCRVIRSRRPDEPYF
jgi:sugar O-acyltransferase (sialic acid O-acetyltransferase NeuD family)